MTLHRIYGHEGLTPRLEAALKGGRFPQATLLTGPAGVGKQRLALWMAQGLLCERGPTTPCGACQACLLVSKLSHPDLHWFVPIVRPKTSDPDKQVQEAEALLADVMAERRAQPLYGPPEGMASHSLASVRLLQRRVALRPFLGSCKVVILGDAERLVVQEASPEAANALLKVLEEPPRDTYLILTAAEPQALLPTIRSRVVTLRVGRVRDEAVRQFLREQGDPTPRGEALERRVALAEGSIGRAIAADGGAGGGGGGGSGRARGGGTGTATRAADRLLEAVAAGAGRWVELALTQPPWAARGDFASMLDALALRIRGGGGAAFPTDGRPLASRVDALVRVAQTREQTQGNVNPQLALAVLAMDLEALP